MKMNVGRSDPPPRDKNGEGEDGGNGKEVKKIKSYSDVMKMKLDKQDIFHEPGILLIIQDDGEP